MINPTIFIVKFKYLFANRLPSEKNGLYDLIFLKIV